MPAIRVDQSCLPVVLTVFNGEQDEQAVDRYIQQMDAVYDRGQRFVGTTFMLRYRPDISQLKRIADWTKARHQVIERICVGTAIYAPSPAFRFLFSTLLMMQPLPVPYTVVSELEEASLWANGRLPKGSRPPRDVGAYLREQLELEQRSG